MIFGPYGTSQALYYTTFAGGGQVRAIAYTGSENRAPVAVAQADPTHGPVPLMVAFDGRSSSDADGDPLSYAWDFGDGPPGASDPAPTHTYASEGAYTATLRVSDGRGGEGSASVRIDPGHAPPLPSIASPGTATRFRVGQTITLRGSAMDDQGRLLPDAALSWTVLLHHDDHTHPFLQPTSGNDVTIVAPAPEDLPAAKTSYLEIRLTATDSRGLSTTISQDLLPRKVDLTFATKPAGLKLKLEGKTIRGGSTRTSWEGHVLRIKAPNQTDADGRYWRFAWWSDGGAREHMITTPSSPATYTAKFR